MSRPLSFSAIDRAKTMPRDKIILANLCGRGDKDISTGTEAWGGGTMIKAAYWSFAIAIVSGAIFSYFYSDSWWLMGIFGATFMFATLVIISDGVKKLYRGDIKLRPWLAVKPFLIQLFIFLALFSLVELIFSADDIDTIDVLIRSTILAAVLSLSQTAYRRRA